MIAAVGVLGAGVVLFVVMVVLALGVIAALDFVLERRRGHGLFPSPRSRRLTDERAAATQLYSRGRLGIDVAPQKCPVPERARDVVAPLPNGEQQL